jgi:molecular chaperone GrpE (heat shock protein)
MADISRLIEEIRQLLRDLSGRFEKLAENMVQPGLIAPDEDSDTSIYSSAEARDIADTLDDTQSLEPPPPDEPRGLLEPDTASPQDDEPKTSEMEAVAADGSTRDKAKSGALPILEKLSRLQELVEKKKLEVSSKDFAFIPKSTEVYMGLSSEDRLGQKGTRILLDCINFLDTISYKYVGSYYAPLRDAVAALTRSLSEFLQHGVGCKVFPLGEETVEDLRAGLDDYEASVQEKQAYGKEPPGTILAIRRRGAAGTEVMRKAQILVSTGESTETAAVLDAGLNAVSALKSGNDRAAEMKLKAMASLTEWREKLYDSGEDYALTVARYALNLLHTLENPSGVESADLFSGQVQKLKSINDRIASVLRAGGLTEIIVSVGGMFDESYDPSKYERKKVPSDKPEGSIIGVLRRGFLDRNGIPVQKAVVAVSGR